MGSHNRRPAAATRPTTDVVAAASLQSCIVASLAMAGNGKFRKALSLSDGRRLDALGDAAGLILNLPEKRRARDHWRHAAQLLAKAQRPMATEMAVDAFVRQLTFALDVEGLLQGGPVDVAPSKSMRAAQ